MPPAPRPQYYAFFDIALGTFILRGVTDLAGRVGVPLPPNRALVLSTFDPNLLVSSETRFDSGSSGTVLLSDILMLAGTAPSIDSDGDGLSDIAEAAIGTNALAVSKMQKKTLSVAFVHRVFFLLSSQHANLLLQQTQVDTDLDGVDDFTEVVTDNTDPLGGRGYGVGTVARLELDRGNVAHDVAVLGAATLVASDRGVLFVDLTSPIEPTKVRLVALGDKALSALSIGIGATNDVALVGARSGAFWFVESVAAASRSGNAATAVVARALRVDRISASANVHVIVTDHWCGDMSFYFILFSLCFVCDSFV
jgi:hypothetical protein